MMKASSPRCECWPHSLVNSGGCGIIYSSTPCDFSLRKQNESWQVWDSPEKWLFATHDFKLVPSTLWWLMACDPPWFMASRRHYFLGCKSWIACFPHQLLTVIVSASSTLSGMLAVKEGNGEMGESIKEKPCSSIDLLLTQAWHLGLLSASISQVFPLPGLAWAFPCPQTRWDPWGDGVENENLSVTVFNLTLILRTPVHRASLAPTAGFTPWHAEHI